MSDSYTKLFSSITDSTIWQEPDHVRIVWVTMLAMADRNGCVWSSVPGLAHRAVKSIEETQDALRRFMAPDEWSRTKDNDGRRIAEIDGGWRLLNHRKFRELRSIEERKEYKRKWDQGHRPSGHARSQSGKVRQSPTKSYESPTSPTPPAPTPSPDIEAKASSVRGTDMDRFDAFWSEFPRKEGKKAARAVWKSKRLDAIADQIIADVVKRKAGHRPWLDGYIPHATTYLRGERWEDEIRARDGPVSVSKTALTHAAIERRIRDRESDDSRHPPRTLVFDRD